MWFQDWFDSWANWWVGFWNATSLWIRGIFGLGLLLVAFTGCGGEMTAEQKIQAWKEVTVFMKDNRIAGQATLDYRGIGEVYAKQAFGMDVGLGFTANAQFNSTEGEALPDAEAPPPID
jgi:hypothetical protein